MALANKQQKELVGDVADAEKSKRSKKLAAFSGNNYWANNGELM